MALIPYTKPHATAMQRVQHLIARGLSVPDPNAAAHEIDLIGYERLRIYFISRRQVATAGRPFRPGTAYQEIKRLYECDARLRDEVFAAVGKFEVLFRNAISETLSEAHGSHPYFVVGAFKDPAGNIDAIKIFTDVYLRSRDRRAKHYRETYGDPILPPIWTLKEFLTFGAASRIYQDLSSAFRGDISRDFGVPSSEVFTSWLECFVDLRNICAHHDRLFNRSFQKQPRTFSSAAVPTAPKNKLKAILQCLDYVLDKRSVPANVATKVSAIIGTYPEMHPTEAGY